MKQCKAIGCTVEFNYSDLSDYCPKCRNAKAANDPMQPVSYSPATPNAMDFMRKGMGHMDDRASQYDAPEGERSMGKTVSMFNILTGHSLTETEGWKFMQVLKMVRSCQGDFREDNYEDGSAYAALAGESHAREVSLES